MKIIQHVCAWLLALMVTPQVQCHGHSLHKRSDDQVILPHPTTTLNGIPFSTRAHWMRVANRALIDLVSPCPFGAFGTAIVKHTGDGLGDLICIGANNISATGNPTLHGEIAAINNCTSILTDPKGPYKLSPASANTALQGLSLYTNAESCPMCASAIRWGGFKEYIYGTTIDLLIRTGWGQITISSYDVFAQSWPLGTSTAYLGGVLTNETDPYFLWQYSTSYPCPSGCSRKGEQGCLPN